ncbi:VC0807 family protein [Pseudalkalibacillus caeni]|uniref:Uncharacterized protein n=1 Tax=Exobacillus caeni TaxID=2574798 RepID=A0A5R9F8T3_9BACL|nr:VC0807 family protein [Pseudalkalibacillus caeni]TLS36115.1 hypothetical protein FCL54_17170 [Pseudalkalibacillus caeni]
MKKLPILDLVFYLVIPLLIWNEGRDLIGDYYAILLSTVPGILYTFYRFFVEKQFNVTGLFIITTMLIGAVVDLLSGDAEAMLWNNVYYGGGIGLFFLLSSLIRKPIAMYFSIDIAYLQGYARQDSYMLYTKKGLFVYFQLLNLLFAFRSFTMSGLKAVLIETYGVEQYDRILFMMNVAGWIFTGIIFIAYIVVGKKTMEFVTRLQAAPDNAG